MRQEHMCRLACFSLIYHSLSNYFRKEANKESSFYTAITGNIM